MDTAVESEVKRTCLGIPIETRATTIYTDLGSADDMPRSVAICPNRKCVAFGCRMGIELHWVNALTGGDLNRWFPLAAPSDLLYFLPQRSAVDSKRKLRLISSATGPVATQLYRADSSPTQWKYWPTSPAFGRRQSLTRLFFGSLPFPTTASPPDREPHFLPSSRRDETQGVLRTVDCDHFRAVPLSDGINLLFTDPTSGFLCLGSDAPLGAPSKLVRSIMFIPPIQETDKQSYPRHYAAGKVIDWGLRIVAVYDDGVVVLYSVPSDILTWLPDQKSAHEVWDECSGVLGQSDLLMDSLVSNQEGASTRPRPSSEASESGHDSPRTPLQIYGSVITHVENGSIDDLAIRSDCGGFSVWIFYRSGRAELHSIYSPYHYQTIVKYIGEDGLVYDAHKEPLAQADDSNHQWRGKARAEDEMANSPHVKWAGSDDIHHDSRGK